MGFSLGSLNPLNVIGDANSATKRSIRSVYDRLSQSPGEEERKRKEKELAAASQAAGKFADQGQFGYGAMTEEMALDRQNLRDLASGKNSVAGEQLRQGLQQNYAAQRSMAASAPPQNAAMAARGAAMNMGRMGMGLSGQQVMAGLAERNAATQALAQLNLGQRGQDVNVGLGSRQNQMTGLAPEKKEPSYFEKAMGYASAGAAKLASDEGLKANIKDGDKAARRAMESLSAKTYNYKDEKFGRGSQLGIIAQDLEKVVPDAVVNTPEGKMVHAGKLGGANTAMIAALGRRLLKLEGNR